MSLKLPHYNFDVYKNAERFAEECYVLTGAFPGEERSRMTSQIRRAALSVLFNIAEGFARKSALERKNFFLIARASLSKADAALRFALAMKYITSLQLELLREIMASVFKSLAGMVRSL